MAAEAPPPGKPGSSPARRRRRRRGKDKARGKSEDPGKGKAPPVVQALVESHIDDRPVEEPLTPAEVAEMRVHLDFLRQHRNTLRIKVNAAEDLLLNGARPPTHRGQCMHLLGKVDLRCVESALARLDDPQGKAKLLAGVVRFSSDVGVLLLYLESLTEERSRSDAAAAFSVAIERVDFAHLSAARMRRVLGLIATTFGGQERIQVLFGLLSSESFCAAFDGSAPSLPDELAELFLPLRAVWDVVFRGAPNRFGEDVLVRGASVLLGAPEPVLRGYPRRIRERLLESATALVADLAVRDRATDALLESLPSGERSYSRLGMRRAAELVRRHEDERAAGLLERIVAAHPDFEQPRRLRSALSAPRIARFALVGARSDPADARLQRAFWLDEQRPVWLRSAGGAEAPRLAVEAALQRELAIAGVLPIVTSGVATDGRPFIALPAVGRPLAASGGRRPARATVTWWMLCGVQLLHGLALLGVRLPDIERRRFVVEEDGRSALMLADFDGAVRAPRDEVEAAHRELAHAWCAELSRSLRAGERPRAVLERAGEHAALPELIAVLAAGLQPGRDGG